MTVKILADRLLAAKLVLPAPVVAFLASRPRPLAVGTSAELVPWTATHGYDAEQTRMLRKIVKGIVYSAAYSQSIVAGIHRQTFDGDDAGPPSESDQNYAHRVLLGMVGKVRARRQKARQQAEREAREAEPPPASSPEDFPAGSSASPEMMATAAAVAEQVHRRRDLEDAIKVRAAPAARKRAIAMAASLEVAARGQGRIRSRPMPASSSSPARLSSFPTSFPSSRASTRTPTPSPTTTASMRSSGSPPSPGLLPQSVIRGAVEQAQARRGSLRLIAVYAKNLNSAAVDRERGAWVSDACQRLAADGHGADAVFRRQTAEMVDEMLVGTVPARARR